MNMHRVRKELSVQSKSLQRQYVIEIDFFERPLLFTLWLMLQWNLRGQDALKKPVVVFYADNLHVSFAIIYDFQEEKTFFAIIFSFRMLAWLILCYYVNTRLRKWVDQLTLTLTANP